MFLKSQHKFHKKTSLFYADQRFYSYIIIFSVSVSLLLYDTINFFFLWWVDLRFMIKKKMKFYNGLLKFYSFDHLEVWQIFKSWNILTFYSSSVFYSVKSCSKSCVFSLSSKQSIYLTVIFLILDLFSLYAFPYF